MNFQDLASFLQGYRVTPDQWQQQVLDGDYLRQGNPYQQSMIDAATRAYQDSLPSIDSRFASSGRFGSGALAAAHARANEGFTLNLNNMLGGLWDNERNRMTQVQGMMSGENQSARGNLSGFAGVLQQAAAAIRQSQIAASASRYGADRQYALGSRGLDLQQAGQEFNHLLSAYGIGNQQNQGNINQQFLGQNNLAGYSNLVTPILQGFGTQTQRNTGGGANVSPFGMGLMGGLGGAATGQGIQNQMGGKN